MSCLKSVWIAIAVLIASVSVAAGPASSDPRVKPGERFTLLFEDLGETWHGWSTRMEVYIPTDYTTKRRFPLLVWFSGSVGSHAVGRPLTITQGKGFILAALPYRKPGEENTTGWKSDWPYYWTMLQALEKAVPNIHPGKRICGGFSSGGLAVTWSIAHSGGAFQKYFYGFIPGGAGGNFGKLGTIKGRPMLMYMGDQDKRYEGFSKIYSIAKSAGVDVEYLVFKNTDHVLPESYFPQFVDWMKRKVVHRDLPAAMNRLNAAMKAGNWPKVMNAATAVFENSDAGTPPYTAAEQALVKACEAADQALDQLLEKPPNEKSLRRFIDQWDDCACVQKAINACNDIGIQQLDKILAQQNKTLATKLMTFMKQWQGFPVHKKALEACDRQLEPELEKIKKSVSNKYMAGKRLKTFADRWAPTSIAEQARTIRNRLADEILTDITSSGSKMSQRSKLKRFIKDYGDTPAGSRARQLLKK